MLKSYITVFATIILDITDHVTPYAPIYNNATHDHFSVNTFLLKILTMHLQEISSIESVSTVSDSARISVHEYIVTEVRCGVQTNMNAQNINRYLNLIS